MHRAVHVAHNLGMHIGKNNVSRLHRPKTLGKHLCIARAHQIGTVSAFCVLFDIGTQKKMRKILSIWKIKKIFDSELLQTIDPDKSSTPPGPGPASTGSSTQPVVTVVTDDFYDDDDEDDIARIARQQRARLKLNRKASESDLKVEKSQLNIDAIAAAVNQAKSSVSECCACFHSVDGPVNLLLQTSHRTGPSTLQIRHTLCIPRASYAVCN